MRVRPRRFIGTGKPRDKYRETIWDPEVGREIVFGELMDAPAFPVEDSAGYVPIFTFFRELFPKV